jgi:hypothetical protein
MRLGTIAINLKRALKGAVGVGIAFLAEVGLADSQMQVGQMRVCTFGSQQTGQRGVHISLFKSNDTHQQIRPWPGPDLFPGGRGLWCNGSFHRWTELPPNAHLSFCWRALTRLPIKCDFRLPYHQLLQQVFRLSASGSEIEDAIHALGAAHGYQLEGASPFPDNGQSQLATPDFLVSDRIAFA